MSTDLADLKTEAEAAGLRRQIAEDTAAAASLAPRTALVEEYGNLVINEAWGDRVNPRGYLNDDPTWGIDRNSWSAVQHRDRLDGRMLPILETDDDLRAIQVVARVIAQVSVNAKCATLNLLNWVMGTGFEYGVEPAEGFEPPPQLVAAVQQVVDDFLEDNDWVGDYEREMYRRSIRDGEYFLGLWHTGGGHVQARAIEPEFVRTPSATPPIDRSYTFGVDTRKLDLHHIFGYFVDWTGEGQPDYMPAEQVEHVKRNVDRNVKRGISDFFPIQEALTDVSKLGRNMVKGSSVAAAIAWIEEFAPGVSAAGASGLQSEHRTMTYQQTDQTGRQRTKSVRNYDPATVMYTEAGRQFKPGPLAQANAANFVAINQAALRIIGSNWCMPEYMISSDASNANYASTMVAESPFVKFAVFEQQFYASRFRRMLWKVIAVASAAGRFNRFGTSLGDLRRQLQLVIDPPKVAATDVAADTERRLKLKAAGVLSTETVANEEGADWEVEKGRGAVASEVPTGGDGAAGGGEDDVAAQVAAQAGTEQVIQTSPDLMLNGAQVTAAVAIVTAVAARTLPRDAGIAQLEVLFNLSNEQALRLMGTSGEGPPPAAITEGGNRLRAAARLLWEGYP